MVDENHGLSTYKVYNMNHNYVHIQTSINSNMLVVCGLWTKWRGEWKIEWTLMINPYLLARWKDLKSLFAVEINKWIGVTNNRKKMFVNLVPTSNGSSNTAQLIWIKNKIKCIHYSFESAIETSIRLKDNLIFCVPCWMDFSKGEWRTG